jgi:small subunit ribosomal protein S17
MVQNEQTNKKKRLYQGVVVSDKMQKTVVAAVEALYKHKQFRKTLRRVKKYKVHDEQGIARVGDVIEFFSGRPLSKTKHMYLNRIVSSHSSNTVI